MTSEIRWLPRAQKDLKRLDPQVSRRVIKAVRDLAESGQGDVRRLVDVSPAEYRLRVGEWRVRFARGDHPGSLEVMRVQHRGKAYR